MAKKNNYPENIKPRMQTRPAKRTPIFEGADKLHTAMLNGDELTERQQEQFDQYKEVWAILLEHPRAAAKKVVMELGYNSRDAYRIIGKSEDFFGNIEAVKIDAERAKQRHRLEAIVLNESYSVEIRLKAERQLSEILGTMRKPEDDANKVKKRRIVRRTTSMKQVKQEAIEEEYGK